MRLAPAAALGFSFNTGGGFFPSLPDVDNTADYPVEDGHQQQQWVKSLQADNDQLVLVHLRDGKTLVGILKAFDHFGNLLLDRTCERLINPRYPTEFAELYLGALVIRGENIILFGSLGGEDVVQDHLQRLARRQRGEPANSSSSTLNRWGLKEVPLAGVLAAQETLEAEERRATAIVADFDRRSKLAALNDLSLEKVFVNELLQGAGTSIYTPGEMQTARMLFQKWLKGVSEAMVLLEHRRALSFADGDG